MKTQIFRLTTLLLAFPLPMAAAQTVYLDEVPFENALGGRVQLIDFETDAAGEPLDDD
jgi:hypothetical protein